MYTKPYTIGNKLAGLSKSLQVYTSGARWKWAAIVINNKQIDTIIINQLSDEDKVVLEKKVGNATLLIASMYFDINRPIHYDLQKMQTIIMHANVLGIVFAVDSNARFTSWHDALPNKRERKWKNY